MARVLFQVPMAGGWIALSLGVLLFIIGSLALGFLISTVARSQLQAMQMSFFYILPSILLSGFMFPFRGMPAWAQAIGEVIPVTHFLRVVRGALLKGEGLATCGRAGGARRLRLRGHGAGDGALPPDAGLSNKMPGVRGSGGPRTPGRYALPPRRACGIFCAPLARLALSAAADGSGRALARRASRPAHGLCGLFISRSAAKASAVDSCRRDSRVQRGEREDVALGVAAAEALG